MVSQEMYLIFDDYVVLEAIHQLNEEHRAVSTRNVRDRFNQIVKQRPPLGYVTHEIKSHTTVAQSFKRLQGAGLVGLHVRTGYAGIETQAFVAFYEDMHQRYGDNILRWPYKIPKGPNGPDWDEATFVHITIQE